MRNRRSRNRFARSHEVSDAITQQWHAAPCRKSSGSIGVRFAQIGSDEQRDARSSADDTTCCRRAGSLSETRPPRAAPAGTAAGQVPGEDNGDNEVYRLVAEGNVVISTPTDRAVGDRAVYDMDQAVLVLTGHDLRLTTPNEVLTARDDVEYWSAKHMAVARGDAVVVTKDSRRIAADVLVAYTVPDDQAHPTPVATQPAQGSGDTLENSGKLEKVEAFGHVTVSTPTEVVTGDRGVYVPETGIALLLDKVRITRGDNQLEGAEAEVNLKTGIARLIGNKGARVAGLIVPESANQDAGAPPGAAPAKAQPTPKAKP